MGQCSVQIIQSLWGEVGTGEQEGEEGQVMRADGVSAERLQCLREMMERETVQTESTSKKVGNVKESVKVKINHSILCNQ